MEKQLFIILLFISSRFFAQNKELSHDESMKIERIIKLFKNKDAKNISEIVNYPLKREYPLRNIKNVQQFTEKFDTLFDKSIIDLISKSEIKDWTKVGWRGIMLNNGVLWMDSEGKITAVNYESKLEYKERQRLIAEQKRNIHPSLRHFKNPVYKISTKHYLIRIDELENGKYRYASWRKSKTESSNPDIVLQNGKIQFEGNGGNHTITFINGDYTYEIYRPVTGTEDTPEISISVLKNNKIILSEEGKLLEK